MLQPYLHIVRVYILLNTIKSAYAGWILTLSSELQSLVSANYWEPFLNATPVKILVVMPASVAAVDNFIVITLSQRELGQF